MMVMITIPLPYMRASFCEISGLSLQKKNSYIQRNSDRLTRKTLMDPSTYRKKVKSFSSKNGKTKRTTTSLKKHKIPIVRNSSQNVFTIARTKDGFCFLLHSARHVLKMESPIKNYSNFS